MFEKYCSHCGEIISIANASYCPFCGDFLLDKKEFLLKVLEELKEQMCSEEQRYNLYNICKCIDFVKEMEEKAK